MAPVSQTSAVRKAVRHDSATELRYSQSSRKWIGRDSNPEPTPARREHTHGDFYPFWNEVPTILLLIIVAMAVAKPF
jgi:hypothetical protein